jgi:hypothetical protein
MIARNVRRLAIPKFTWLHTLNKRAMKIFARLMGKYISLYAMPLAVARRGSWQYPVFQKPNHALNALLGFR